LGPTDRDLRCLSPLRRKTSELEREEEYTSIFRALKARSSVTKLNLFPQIRVARTTINLVSRSFCFRRFEYLAGKCYVASDRSKTVKKSTFYQVRQGRTWSRNYKSPSSPPPSSPSPTRFRILTNFLTTFCQLLDNFIKPF
jgi:hypothetical protein